MMKRFPPHHMIYKLVFPLILLGVFLVLSGPAAFSSSPTKPVVVLTLESDSINPVTADYLIHGIDEAERQNAQSVIIKLDTPGGLLESTRQITKKILSSKIPIITYVSPSGARAGSAGVFITYASHIAAMAPSTNIGAAHPVDFSGRGTFRKHSPKLKKIPFVDPPNDFPFDQESPDVSPGSSPSLNQELSMKTPDSAQEQESELESEDILGDKILNDTVAFIKAMAQRRHRNIEWAVKSVTESDSITESEALEKGVIDLVASDEQDLLRQLDGRRVEIDGKEVVLDTKEIFLRRIDMDERQHFLNVLANPNIAYIFLLLGFYGLLYEITHPGFGVPGIVGLILLILSSFSMQMLPTNYAGVALILFAVILFIAEAKVAGIGFLAAGGVVSMVLGSIIMFDSTLTTDHVSWSLIAALTFFTSVLTIFLVRVAIQAKKGKVLSGKEEMLSAEGVVYADISAGGMGKVFVHGEIWNATADELIRKDERVKVVEVNGLELKVRKMHLKDT